MPTSISAPDPQPAIFDKEGRAHWAGEFSIAPDADLDDLRARLSAARSAVRSNLVVAFGPDLMHRLAPGATPADHAPLVSRTGVEGTTMPATQTDLFLWLCGSAPDVVVDDVLSVRDRLGASVELVEETTAFVYLDSRDLSGFEDGTANPPPADAPAVALVPSGPGAGGSHVLVQKWLHDLDSFLALDIAEQEAAIGRTKPDSVELDPLPADSHVAMMEVHDADGNEREIWRRSVAWGDYGRQGLLFLAFSADPDIFDHMLDHLFAFSHGPEDRLLLLSEPVTGARYFAPSVPDLDAALALR